MDKPGIGAVFYFKSFIYAAFGPFVVLPSIPAGFVGKAGARLLRRRFAYKSLAFMFGVVPLQGLAEPLKKSYPATNYLPSLYIYTSIERKIWQVEAEANQKTISQKQNFR